MKEQLLKQIIEKQDELIAFYGKNISDNAIFLDVHGMKPTKGEIIKGQELRSELSLLKSQLEEEEKKARKKLSDPNLCCICHQNYVDSSSGFDTCNSCLKNI